MSLAQPVFAPEGKGENSAWFGNLKDDLGLPDRITDVDFSHTIDGLHPATGKELVKTGAKKEHRGGIDLAFSAPKSVSIAALHLGDKKITEAHNKAVQKALAYVEQNCIYYRETKGETHYVQADNMLAAMFTHATSRANDPQLHTHCVIQNMTKTKNGRYKAISNEQIFKYQKLINNIYQNELALNLQELGYAIDNYNNKFEIQGISEEVRDKFSKRSKQIDEMYEKIKDKYPDLSKEEVRDIAVLESRSEKNPEISLDKLHKMWESDVAKESIQPVQNGEKRHFERDLVKLSLAELQKTEATFAKHDLLNIMIAQSRGEFTLNELETMLDTTEKEKRILKMGEHKGQVHYATPEMIKTEVSIVASIKQGKNTKTAFMTEKEAEIKLQASLAKDNIKTITNGQKEFVNRILSSKDFLTVVQGDAGTGKTFVVNQIRSIIETEKLGAEIVGLGFTGKAAQELAEAAKIETSTIASFMLSNKPVDGKLIIVDEASMVSSEDMLNLIEKASNGNNRIVLVGDRKQLQAIGAGKMFTELQREHIVEAVEMTETMRQKTDTTKAIVANIKNFQEMTDKNGMNEAFRVMEENKCIEQLVSTSKNEEVTTAMIQKRAMEEYFASDGSVLLSPSRAVKSELNVKIRDEIFTKEQLAQQHTIRVKENIDQSYLATSYKVGDRVKYGKKDCKIIEIDGNTNTVTMEYRYKNAKNAEQIRVNLFEEQINAYRERDQKFLAGDKIIFTQNDKQLKVQNGLSGKIENIDKHGNVTVGLKDDKKVIFNTANYSNIDYGYALTLHKSQGQTCHKAILVHTAGDNMSSESFYVAATRVTHEFKVITPDAKALKKSVAKEQDKTSTREFKDRADIYAKNMNNKELE